MLGLFFLFLLLAASPAWAVDYYFCSTGNDANNCTNNTTQLCKTCNRAMTRSTATGRRLLLCDSDVLHEDPEPCTTNAAGASEANPNIIGLYDADDGSYIPTRGSPPPGDGSVPVYTQFTVKTGWQQCNAGVCPAPINGANPNIWRVSHTVAGLTNVLSGRGILIDPFLQNTSAHGFTCTLNWSDPSTWDEVPNCWHPNRGGWGDINGGAAITCPSTQLNQEYENCYNTATGHVYLYTTSNPNTTFTDPGILLINQDQGRENSAFVFRHSNWRVENFAVIGCAHNCFFIPTSDTPSTTFNTSNITIDSMLVRHARYRTATGDPGGSDGSNTGSPLFQSGQVGGIDDTVSNLTNITLRNTEASDTGRDWWSVGAEACINGVTIDNVLAYNAFNHAIVNIKHDGDSAQCRDNIVFNHFTILHHCDAALGIGGAGSMTAGQFVELSYTDSFIGLPSIQGDARRPNSADCSSIGNHEVIDVDRPRAQWTLSRLAIIGEETPISIRNADSTVSCNHCTIVGGDSGAYSRQGIEMTVSGAGSMTTTRSIVHNHGTAAVNANSWEIGSTVAGSTFLGGDAAGDANAFYHSGSAQFGRKSTTAYDLAGWRTANPNADGQSTLEDCLITDVANRDLMLTAASPCDDDLTDTPRVGANSSKGALEEMAILSCATTGATSFSCTIDTIYSTSRNVEGVPARITSLTGSVSGAHTISGCTAGTTYNTPVCSVTPAFVGGETITLTPNTGAFRHCALGATQACIYSKTDSTAPVAVTNNISAGNMRIGDCVYYNANPDKALVTILDVPTLPVVATNAGWRGRRGTSTCPGAQQSAPENVTASGNVVTVDNVGAVVAGECAHMSYDPATGATVDSSGTPVEVEAATNFLCRNRVGALDTPPVFAAGTTIDADTVELCWSTDFSPMTPASGITGISCRRNGAAWTVSGTCDRQGATCMRCNMSASAVAGETLDCSYSQGSGNWVDSDSVPNEAATVTNASIDNTLSGGPPAPGTLVAEGARWRAAEVAGEAFNHLSSILNGTLNNAIVLAPGALVQGRFQFSCQGATACTTQSYHLACSTNGGSTWFTVADTFGGNVVACGEDSTVTSQGATTDVLGSGTGTFRAGTFNKLGSCTSQALDLSSQHTELVFVLQVATDATPGTAVVCEVQTATQSRFDTPATLGFSVVAGTATR